MSCFLLDKQMVEKKVLLSFLFSPCLRERELYVKGRKEYQLKQTNKKQFYLSNQKNLSPSSDSFLVKFMNEETFNIHIA